jgi:hypothetical protein
MWRNIELRRERERKRAKVGPWVCTPSSTVRERDIKREIEEAGREKEGGRKREM